MSPPITPGFGAAFASEWIEAWNARDLDRILKHYAAEIELTSPFVGRILGGNENAVVGIAELRAYFSRALTAYPQLRFVARRLFLGAESVVLEFESVENRVAAEMMKFNDAGLIVRARAHYAQ